MKNNAIFVKGLIIGFLWALMPAQGFAMEDSKSNQEAIKNAVIAWLQQETVVSSDNTAEDQDIEKAFAQESALMQARIKAFNELEHNGIQLEYKKISTSDSKIFYLLNYKVQDTNHYFVRISLPLWKSIHFGIQNFKKTQKSYLLDLFADSVDSAHAQAEWLMEVLEDLTEAEQTPLDDYFCKFFEKTKWTSLEDFCNFIAIVNQLDLMDCHYRSLSRFFASCIAKKFVAEYEQTKSLTVENAKLMLTVTHKCVSNMIQKYDTTIRKWMLEKAFRDVLGNSFEESPFAPIINSANNQLKLPDKRTKMLQNNELIDHFAQATATNATTCFCGNINNNSEGLQQLLEGHAEFSDRDLIKAFLTVSSDAEKINVLSKEDSPFVFFEYISKDNKKSYFISMSREDYNRLSHKLQFFESQNDFITSDNFRIVTKLPATSLEAAETQVNVINRLCKDKTWNETKQRSFLYDIYDKPLENLFESCVFLDYCGFNLNEPKFAKIFSKLLASKLVTEYYKNEKNISNDVLNLIRGNFGRLFSVSELEEALIKAFYCKKNSYLDLACMLNDKKIADKDVRRMYIAEGEQLFNESPFACIPEFYTEMPIPQKLPGRVASIMGKVGQLWYGSKNNVLEIDQEKAKSTEKISNTPNSYKGLGLARLRCGHLFGSLFTTRSAVSNKSLDQINKDKCSFKDILGMYARVKGSLHFQ